MIRIDTSGWSDDHWVGVLLSGRELPSARRSDSTFAGTAAAAAGVCQGASRPHPLPSPEVARAVGGVASDAGGYWATARQRSWWQLHPEQQRDDERLDHFLGLMPDWICAAVELRHRSWDGAGLPCIARSTTDAVYVRMHGPGESLDVGSYSDADLQRWAVSPSGGQAATGSSISTMTATARPCRTQGR